MILYGLYKKIRPVNRLDKDTSGIVIFAKNEYIQECLIKQMTNNLFEKKYIAIVSGIFNQKSGTINAPIARENNSIIKRIVSPDGDFAITHYKVIGQKKDISLLDIKLETGRTHQIRVHLNYINHLIIGDTLYGKASIFIARQALHNYKTSFFHPITKRKVTYYSKIPPDIRNLWKSI